MTDFRVGETVLISQGPFAHFSGVITEVEAERRRLELRVNIFGDTMIEVGFSDVEKSDDNDRRLHDTTNLN